MSTQPVMTYSAKFTRSPPRPARRWPAPPRGPRGPRRGRGAGSAGRAGTRRRCVNARTPNQSVNAITPWILALRLSLNTVPCWCSVRHQFTEKCTIGHVDERDQRGDRAPLGPRFGRGGDAAQRQVAEVEEEEHRGGDEARVPRPPDAPHRASPQRAEDERERGEDHAELGGGAGDPVPDRGPGAGPQPERRPERGDAEREVRDPRRGHVQVHEPLGVALDRGRAARPTARTGRARSTRPSASHPSALLTCGLSSLMLEFMLPPGAARKRASRSR